MVGLRDPEFMLWAFGEDYSDIIIAPIQVTLDRWNERHGDKLWVKTSYDRGDSEKAMLQLFKEENNVKTT